MPAPPRSTRVVAQASVRAAERPGADPGVLRVREDLPRVRRQAGWNRCRGGAGLLDAGQQRPGVAQRIRRLDQRSRECTSATSASSRTSGAAPGIACAKSEVPGPGPSPEGTRSSRESSQSGHADTSRTAPQGFPRAHGRTSRGAGTEQTAPTAWAPQSGSSLVPEQLDQIRPTREHFWASSRTSRAPRRLLAGAQAPELPSSCPSQVPVARRRGRRSRRVMRGQNRTGTPMACRARCGLAHFAGAPAERPG